MNKAKENIMKSVFLLCALCSVAAVTAICIFLFARGLPAIAEIGPFKFIFGTKWKPTQGIFGILPMIVGSIYVTAGAMVIGVPIGVLTAVFLYKYCHDKLYKLIKPAIDLLAGIPSIVYGFFALVVIVPIVQMISDTSGKGMFTASLILGIMILPTIISTTESSLKATDTSYFEGSLALGATKERSIFFSVFPTARSGILSGIILGVGRAIGETMAVVMIIGNQAIFPKTIFSGIRTMTANIVLEMAYAEGLHLDALIATAVVLFVFIMIINISFSCLKESGRKQGKNK